MQNLSTQVKRWQAVIREKGEVSAKNIPLTDQEAETVRTRKIAKEQTVFIHGEEYSSYDVLLKKINSGGGDGGMGDYPRFFIRHSMTSEKHNGHPIYLLEQMRCDGGSGVECDTKIWEKLGIWDKEKNNWEITGAVEKEKIDAKFSNVSEREKIMLVDKYIEENPDVYSLMLEKNLATTVKLDFLKRANQEHLAKMKARCEIAEHVGLPRAQTIREYSSLRIFQ